MQPKRPDKHERQISTRASAAAVVVAPRVAKEGELVARVVVAREEDAAKMVAWEKATDHLRGQAAAAVNALHARHARKDNLDLVSQRLRRRLRRWRNLLLPMGNPWKPAKVL